jgi:hypothetical protein
MSIQKMRQLFSTIIEKFPTIPSAPNYKNRIGSLVTGFSFMIVWPLLGGIYFWVIMDKFEEIVFLFTGANLMFLYSPLSLTEGSLLYYIVICSPWLLVLSLSPGFIFRFNNRKIVLICQSCFSFMQTTIGIFIIGSKFV